ncbi:hypothetical protein QFZ77_001232 [Paenibacillus sp. V4I3]|uniref:hypothetical protein n=1 Tax=Paenibacillus sp. V4I3 TaxID=3042305 RepID=UPI002789EC49|nr:hypothetical protein [Paenibacillus sp. V4I3]MDQ0872573.1 hypothetical protein [Paenibacillus sp. V4I3]
MRFGQVSLKFDVLFAAKLPEKASQGRKAGNTYTVCTGATSGRNTGQPSEDNGNIESLITRQPGNRDGDSESWNTRQPGGRRIAGASRTSTAATLAPST